MGLRFLGKTTLAATLMWLPVAVVSAIAAAPGHLALCVVTGTWHALPAWPFLFAVSIPVMGLAELLALVRDPEPARAPARSRRRFS